MFAVWEYEGDRRQFIEYAKLIEHLISNGSDIRWKTIPQKCPL